MKLLRQADDKLTFELEAAERLLLFRLLELYPVRRNHRPGLSRTTSTPQIEQAEQLLDEALEEQRHENQEQLRRFLQTNRGPDPDAEVSHLTLQVPQVEWLLQILNDIRVGSWTNLGCPDQQNGELPAVTPQNAQHFWAMEMSGYFQSWLIEALG